LEGSLFDRLMMTDLTKERVAVVRVLRWVADANEWQSRVRTPENKMGEHVLFFLLSPSTFVFLFFVDWSAMGETVCSSMPRFLYY